jgi:predicted metalloendopeptidase
VKKLMPNFNMSQYLERAEAPPGDSANVSEPEFLKAVDQVIASTPLPDLKTYMRWHVVHAQAAHAAEAFVDENFAFYGKTLTGAQEQRRAGSAASRRPTAISARRSARLRRAHLRPEGKARTLEMVRRSRRRWARHRGRSTGCRPRRRRRRSQAARRRQQDRLSRSLARLLALRIVRGDAYGNSQRANTFEYRRQMAKIGKPVDKTEWLMTPPTVNAYYNPLENNINFPAGILQPPFFIKAATKP